MRPTASTHAALFPGRGLKTIAGRRVVECEGRLNVIGRRSAKWLNASSAACLRLS